MSKIKWGIISTGTIANAFAQDFACVQEGALLAVASRNIKKAQDFADKYSIPKAYGSYAELLSDTEIDAIYVATPHSMHLENALAALDQDKAVLCEKPITINPKECDQLLAFAKSKNQYLMEGLWTYFLPAIRKAQQWIGAGRIGTVKTLKADFGYPVPFDAQGRMYNPDLAGGALLDMGIYPIAMAWLFLQKNPLKMTVVNRNASTGVDDDVSMLWEYEDEVAMLSTSFRSKLHNHLYIIGTEGYIEIPDFWRAKECKLYKVEEQVDHFLDDRKSLGFNFEIDAVNDDIQNGRLESSIASHAVSRKLQQLMAQVKSQFK